jgi:hypothetical protein
MYILHGNLIQQWRLSFEQHLFERVTADIWPGRVLTFGSPLNEIKNPCFRNLYDRLLVWGFFVVVTVIPVRSGEVARFGSSFRYC